MKEYGFVSYSRCTFIRLCNKIIQALELQLSSWGSKDFAVNYFIFPVFPPREFISSTFAGSIPKGKAGVGWWSAIDHEKADTSMKEVVDKLFSFGLPLFDKSSSLPGLINELLKLSKHGNPHTFFSLGCTLAYAQRINEAVVQLENAKYGYQKAYGGIPQREWCLTSIQQVDELLNAISDGSHINLLENWETKTWKYLKLHKKLKG